MVKLIFFSIPLLSVWFGVVFVRSGIYESGIFRFSLFIPHSFPNCTVCPNLVFESTVFHPLVDPFTNELYFCFKSLKNWKKEANHLWQVINYMNNIFYNVTTDGSVNEHAAYLWVLGVQMRIKCLKQAIWNLINFHVFCRYESDRDEYIKLAKECVEISKNKIYEKSNDDPHYLMFDTYDAQIHEPYREILRKCKRPSVSHFFLLVFCVFSI